MKSYIIVCTMLTLAVLQIEVVPQLCMYHARFEGDLKQSIIFFNPGTAT